MSKASKRFCLIVATFGVLTLAFPYAVLARSRSWRPPHITAVFRIESGPTPLARISGRFSRDRQADRQKSFTIPATAAGLNLGDRVEDLELQDRENNPISFRKMGVGEYLADREIDEWSYTIALNTVSEPRAAAHASWFSGDVGILMLRDLLPEFGPEPRSYAWINLVPPTGLSVTGLSPIEDPRFFNLSEVMGGRWHYAYDEAVAFIGNGWRTRRVERLSGVELKISGQWHFTDENAEDVIREIYGEYKKRFGQDPVSGATISIAKFPREVKHGQWEAETRGNNVTIISSDMPFKAQSIQRLHEQLRHELFHLWIPNDVNLTGNYDWFYEGFALYQSLKLAVAVNRIRFVDFLDTLSRAHTIDSARSQRISLIDASRTRFSGANTQVYARGMLVAFLTDLELLQRSKGNRSVEDVLKELSRKHRVPAAAADGNQAVMELFKSNPGLDQIINKFVTGVDNIDWTSELATAGISDSDPGPITTLKVNEKLNGRQKTLLDKLGYNNWRKLTPVSK